MKHDCTKCSRPILDGQERESFGVLYHKTCAPRNATAMYMKQRSKIIPHRNDRRAKDARKHFTRDEW